MKNKILMLSCILCMIIGTVFGATKRLYPLDIGEHWSEKIVMRCIDREITQASSTTKKWYPDAYILKADIVYTINRLCDFTKTADTSKYTDLNKSNWWEADFKKAEAAGYLYNKVADKVEPESRVNREEFMVMIARALNLPESDFTVFDKYEDKDKVTPELKQEVANYLKAFGFNGNDLNGNGIKELIPQNDLTKADCMYFTDLAFDTYYLEYKNTKYTDTRDHWSYEIIEELYKRDIASGDKSFNIYPDGEVFNADLYFSINNLLGLTEEADISKYTDVKETDWFYPHSQKAVAAGYVLEKNATTLGANKRFTREELFTMLAKALKLPDVDNVDEILSIYEDPQKVDAKYRQTVANYLAVYPFNGNDLDKNGKRELIPQNLVTKADMYYFLYQIIPMEKVEIAEGEFVKGSTVKLAVSISQKVTGEVPTLSIKYGRKEPQTATYLETKDGKMYYKLVVKDGEPFRDITYNVSGGTLQNANNIKAIYSTLYNRLNAKYKVEYAYVIINCLEKDTNKKLYEKKVKIETNKDEQIPLPNIGDYYVPVSSVATVNRSTKDEEYTLNYIYRKEQGKVKIKYLNESSEEIKEATEEIINAGEEKTYIAQTLPGYILVSDIEQKVKLSADGEEKEIKFIYRKRTIEDAEYGSVKIKYQDTTGKELKAIETDKAVVGDILIYQPQDIVGYVPQKTRETVTLSTKGEEKEITFVYNKTEINTKLGTIKVLYCLVDSSREIYTQKAISGVNVGEEKEIIAPELEGYNIVGDKYKKITLTQEGETPTVIFRYKKDKEYEKGKIIIRYIDYDTGVNLKDPEVYSDLTLNQAKEFTVSTIDGYALSMSGVKSSTPTAEVPVQNIVVYCVKNNSIVAIKRYLDQDGKDIVTPELEENLPINTTTPIEGKDISGYNISSDYYYRAYGFFATRKYIAKFNYVKSNIGSITVKYKDAASDEEIYPRIELQNQILLEEKRYTAPEIDNYTLIDIYKEKVATPRANGPHVEVEFRYSKLDNVKEVNTVADLKSGDFKDGDIVRTKGYTSVGDLGNATYEILTKEKWEKVIPQDILYISVANKLEKNTPEGYGNHILANGLYARYVTDGIIRPEQWGAVGDGVTDSNKPLQAMFAFIKTGTIEFKKDAKYILAKSSDENPYKGFMCGALLGGQYFCKPIMANVENIIFEGNNCTIELPKNGWDNTGMGIFNFGQRVDGLEIKNFHFEGNGDTMVSDVKNSAHTIFYSPGVLYANGMGNEIAQADFRYDPSYKKNEVNAAFRPTFINNVNIHHNTFNNNGTMIRTAGDYGGDFILIVNPTALDKFYIEDNTFTNWGRWVFAIDLGGNGERLTNIKFNRNTCLGANRDEVEGDGTWKWRALGLIDFEARKCFSNVEFCDNTIEGTSGWAINGNSKVSDHFTIKNNSWKHIGGGYPYMFNLYSGYFSDSVVENNLFQGPGNLWGITTRNFTYKDNTSNTGARIKGVSGNLLFEGNILTGTYHTVVGIESYLDSEYLTPEEKQADVNVIVRNNFGGMTTNLVDETKNNIHFTIEGNQTNYMDIHIWNGTVINVDPNQYVVKEGEANNGAYTLKGTHFTTSTFTASSAPAVGGGIYKAGDLISDHLEEVGVPSSMFFKSYQVTKEEEFWKKYNGGNYAAFAQQKGIKHMQLKCTETGYIPFAGEWGFRWQDNKYEFMVEKNTKLQQYAYIYTEDNLYMAMNDGLLSDIEPTHTSGIAKCGEVDLKYITKMGKAELVFLGE